MTQKITWVEDTSRFSEDNDIISFFSKNVDPCFLEQLAKQSPHYHLEEELFYVYLYISNIVS